MRLKPLFSVNLVTQCLEKRKLAKKCKYLFIEASSFLFRDCFVNSLDVHPIEAAIVIKYMTKLSLTDESGTKPGKLIKEKTDCTKL